MQYLDLDILKKHLNVDPYFTEDDNYIMQLSDVAEQMVAVHLDDNLDAIVADNDGELPAPILHAMLLLVGNLYQNREGISFTSASEIPFSYEYLLAGYKQYRRSQL